jgi:hypothetical protein
MIDLTKCQDRTLIVRLFCVKKSKILKRNIKESVEINVLPPTVNMRKELGKMSDIQDISDAYAVLSKVLSHNREGAKIEVKDLEELDIDGITTIIQGYLDWINKVKIEKN